MAIGRQRVVGTGRTTGARRCRAGEIGDWRLEIGDRTSPGLLFMTGALLVGSASNGGRPRSSDHLLVVPLLLLGLVLVGLQLVVVLLVLCQL